MLFLNKNINVIIKIVILDIFKTNKGHVAA